ncbi:MAG: hypothetical protein IJA10_16095, partial [Lachnospiraceae bacterium]|nr:hypothetical protein [Lachnospiraceae bacterium]
ANITPLKILHKTMQWANMVVTVYDTWEMCEKLQSGESTVMDVAFVIMGGILINGLLQCWVGSETAAIILKAVNAKMSSNSLKEAIKSRDPEKIMIEVLRFMVALYSFHCECFTGETLVSTTEGDKRIDEIEVGDYVYAYDTETEETVPARVTYVSVTETNILVHIYTSEGEGIKTTMLHPFYVKNAKNGEDETYGIWKASANLVAGDELLTDDGRVVYVEEVRIERLAESIKVYNLEVEGLHTYYVGNGVLVHNQYGKKNTNDGNESGSTISDQEPDLYHYTDADGAKAIQESEMIKTDSKGRVFVTTDEIKPQDANNALFMGTKGDDCATHRVEITLVDPNDINLTTKGVTQPNELIYFGIIRNGKNANFIVKENDF